MGKMRPEAGGRTHTCRYSQSRFGLGFSRLQRDLGVSRVDLLLCASRHQGALPADSLWGIVGCGPAAGSCGHVHARLRAGCRRFLPGRALSVVRLYRSGALDVVRFRGRHSVRQYRRWRGLISKVYFPRIIVPLGSAASFLLDFAIGLVLLAVMLVYYAVTPSVAILLLPFFSAMAFMSALAVGVWLSALNVRYRDVRYVIPFLLQVLLFLSPLGYSVTDIHGPARVLYALNPVTGFAEGFRWVVLGLPPTASGILDSPDTGNCRSSRHRPRVLSARLNARSLMSCDP